MNDDASAGLSLVAPTFTSERTIGAAGRI